MKYYTIQENYKDGLLVSKSSMKGLEVLLNLENSIKRNIDSYLEFNFKVARNGDDIIVVSSNPVYDMHIIKHEEYEEEEE
jgi:hypothetical protein